jgi:hypothetical protein
VAEELRGRSDFKTMQQNIENALGKARLRMYEVELLAYFMVKFREAYKKARLSGQPKAIRENIFNQVYTEFAASNNFVRGSPHLRIRCFQSAMLLPLEIPSILDSKERVPNPAFEITSQVARLQYFRSLADALK